MKHLLLFFSGFFMLCTASASHLMGAEMTVKDIGNNQQVVHLALYRDITGITLQSSQTVQIVDSLGNWSATANLELDTVNSAQLLPGYPVGVEVYHYYDTVNITTPGLYYADWSSCCRNAVIQNISSPGAANQYVNTEFTVFSGASNSTPTFLALPVIYLPQNYPWQYNPMPFDADGDSLVWSIDVPLEGAGVPNAGYVAPSANVGGAFSIDPVTGVVSWNADLLGHFVADILVEEYRNGVKIGEIRRDMQYIVIAGTQSSLPLFTNVNTIPLNPDGYPQLDLNLGQAFNYSFLASDPDAGDELWMYAYSGAFDLATNPATFSTSHPGGALNAISGDFNWTPDLAAMNNSPYLLNLRVLDGLFAYDETVLLNLENTLGVEAPALNEGMGELYPNPSTGFVSVPLSLETASNTRLVVRDLQGREVQSFSKHLNEGEHLLTLDLQVPAGTYLLQWISDDVSMTTKPLIITR